MPYEMTKYKIDGQEIYVREEGRQGKPIAILIHGWSSSWYALSPLIPYLRKRFYCMAVDLPGFGLSPRLSERATMTGYANLIAKLIQEKTDKPVILIGHSMGGMISLTLNLHHPELVERMVLLCPTISGHLSLFVNMFISPITILERFPLADILISLIEPHVLGLTDYLMLPASFSERSVVSEKDYRQLRADARRMGQGKVRAECFWAMRNGDLRGKLSKIKTHSLIIWGMEDNTVPLRDASALAAEWPDADLRILPGTSHWPQFETPKLTQRYIEGFLGKPLKLLNLHTALGVS